jgi:hypothetical protein
VNRVYKVKVYSTAAFIKDYLFLLLLLLLRFSFFNVVVDIDVFTTAIPLFSSLPSSLYQELTLIKYVGSSIFCIENTLINRGNSARLYINTLYTNND